MDRDAPADGWYVWPGVSITSLAIAGFVLWLPTRPLPDADQAADEMEIDGKAIELRNEHGTDRSRIRSGEAVNGEERLEDLVYGEDFESVYEDADELDRIERSDETGEYHVTLVVV